MMIKNDNHKIITLYIYVYYTYIILYGSKFPFFHRIGSIRINSKACHCFSQILTTSISGGFAIFKTICQKRHRNCHRTCDLEFL